MSLRRRLAAASVAAGGMIVAMQAPPETAGLPDHSAPASRPVAPRIAGMQPCYLTVSVHRDGDIAGFGVERDATREEVARGAAARIALVVAGEDGLAARRLGMIIQWRDERLHATIYGVIVPDREP